MKSRRSRRDQQRLTTKRTKTTKGNKTFVPFVAFVVSSELISEAIWLAGEVFRLRLSYAMFAEVHLPGAAGSDEGLHQGSLGLEGVVQVVGGPFVHHLPQGYGPQFQMA